MQVIKAGRAPGSLQITYTGTPQVALVLPLAPGIASVPAVAGAGQATFTATAGPTINSFSYSESAQPIPGKQLLTLSFDDLDGVSGNFSLGQTALLTTFQANAVVNIGGNCVIGTHTALTTFRMNALVNVAGNFQPSTMPALTTFEVNSLVNVGALFAPTTMAVLTVFRVNSLVNIIGAFTPQAMAALTTFEANALLNVGGNFNPSAMGSLVTFQVNSVQNIAGNMSPLSMGSLTTWSLAGMVKYGGTISIPSASMANVSNVTLGTIGTLKAIAGATITLSGLKLPSANVNAILALLVSLDGTAGTTLWGPAQTLTINGGTNGAPTGQGATDKTTLQGRGATITTN